LLGAAAVCGLLVVQVALAGTSPGADGPKATASAGVKKKLNSLQRQIDALKGRTGTPGPQGAQGIPGPGAISFDRQFPVDTQFHVVTTVNGLVLSVGCNVPGTKGAAVLISPVAHGWGTEAEDGVLESSPVSSSVTGNYLGASGINFADLDVVAISTAPVEPGKWTRIDANVIRGNACNFHGMVTPSASVG